MRTTTAALSITLLRRLFNRHKVFLAVIGALLAGFQILTCAIIANTDFAAAFLDYGHTLTPLNRDRLGNFIASLFPLPARVSFAWNHPVVHAMLASVMIMLGSRAIAAEAEGGTLELVLSHPISRPVYLATQVLFMVVVLTALVGVMLAGFHAGLVLFALDEAMQGHAFWPLAANLISLEVALYGVTLCVSAWLSEGGRVVVLATMFVFVSFLIQAVGTLWEAIDFLLVVTVFDYYSPREILLDNVISWRNMLVLWSVGLVAGGAGWITFMRRNIP